MSKLYLIVGASGTVGSQLASGLLSSGARVRGITSKPVSANASGRSANASGRSANASGRSANASGRSADGIEWVQADLASGKGVSEAFEGVSRAFLLSPPGFADQYRILSPLIAEASRRKLEKVVLMTAMGADANPDSPMGRAELELERTGLRYNIIRPNWFMQNFHTFWLPGIRDQRKILLPAGRAKVSFIDSRDISAVAQKLLEEVGNDALANQAFVLTGPASIDHDEVARALVVATGLPIRYEEIEPKVLGDGMKGAGVPADYVDFLLLILGYLREGYSAGLTDSVRRILGREPTDIHKYARDFARSWA